ncbi:MAG: tetratricopeptide repeat protein [Candidatus Omnitrophica bacterium]|nr:tetratricopeptide repeat protein [Candidatus Omnitrophota bacterium]
MSRAKKIKNYITVIFFIYLLSQNIDSCFAATSSVAKEAMKKAKQLYHQGKFDQAIEQYHQASLGLPESETLAFNMGTSYYKKGDYEKALEHFTKSLATQDKIIEADALYNIGNTHYQIGRRKEQIDLEAAIAHYRSALDYYKRAIELDQKNKDARFNHEFVERRLKILLDKLKQQKQENQDQQCPLKKDSQQKQDESGTSSTDKDNQKQQQQGQQKPSDSDQKETNQDSQKEQAEQQKNFEQEEQEEQKEKTEQGSQEDQDQNQITQPQQATDQQRERENKSRSEQEGQQGQNGSIEELTTEQAQALLDRYGNSQSLDSIDKKDSLRYDGVVIKDW